MSLFNRIFKRFYSKPPEDSMVQCDGCNDYGYIVVTFGGCTAKMRCTKCDGKYNKNNKNDNCEFII